MTGSSRGIGRAIALRLAANGADVLVNYCTNERAADEVVAAIRQMGRRAESIRADVSKCGDLDRAFDYAERVLGGLDIYVNNAIDVAAFGPVRRLKIDSWRHTIDSHVTAFLRSAQLSASLMARQGAGAIVAISSLGSRVCLPGYAAVGVGKAAIECLTRYLAVELAPIGIRVNAVTAGPIETDALRLMPGYDGMRHAATRTPARRLGRPEDVATVVTFLCTDDAQWIYGQTIVADGGLSLQRGSQP